MVIRDAINIYEHIASYMYVYFIITITIKYNYLEKFRNLDLVNIIMNIYLEKICCENNNVMVKIIIIYSKYPVVSCGEIK